MPLTTKGHFKINDNEFKAQNLKVSYTSIQTSDSDRTDDGMTHIDFILSNKRKVQITLPPIDDIIISKLFSDIQGKTYSLTYYDPIKKGEYTINCYSLTTNANMYSGIVLDGLWNGVSFTAIELGGE